MTGIVRKASRQSISMKPFENGNFSESVESEEGDGREDEVADENRSAAT
jgi:hypothetical protein